MQPSSCASARPDRNVSGRWSGSEPPCALTLTARSRSVASALHAATRRPAAARRRQYGRYGVRAIFCLVAFSTSAPENAQGRSWPLAHMLVWSV